MEEELDGHKGRITSVLSPYEQGFLFSTLYDWKDKVQEDTKVWIGLTDREVCSIYKALKIFYIKIIFFICTSKYVIQNQKAQVGKTSPLVIIM